ncbi:hypothetical protein AALA79_09855 [Lachnospiraceae bacterium 64-25]|nr:hypothetical protein IMSAGC005_02898 [Lachnospiraceae bacterium]
MKKGIAIILAAGLLLCAAVIIQNSKDKANLPDSSSEEQNYPEEKIEMRATPGEMIIEHEYIE